MVLVKIEKPNPMTLEVYWGKDNETGEEGLVIWGMRGKIFKTKEELMEASDNTMTYLRQRASIQELPDYVGILSPIVIIVSDPDSMMDFIEAVVEALLEGGVIEA